MSISVLNNISSLVAENAVSNTQASLQNTLQQLSTGLKINSGSDDAAGLAIADGLGANIAALTQSSQNASNGIECCSQWLSREMLSVCSKGSWHTKHSALHCKVSVGAAYRALWLRMSCTHEVQITCRHGSRCVDS